jgi:hypothetical protein
MIMSNRTLIGPRVEVTPEAIEAAILRGRKLRAEATTSLFRGFGRWIAHVAKSASAGTEPVAPRRQAAAGV